MYWMIMVLVDEYFTTTWWICGRFNRICKVLNAQLKTNGSISLRAGDWWVIIWMWLGWLGL